MAVFPNLFDPINIGSMQARNRTVMGPMGTGFADPSNNFPTDRMAYYYGERSKGGTGLVIVEQVVVQQRGLWSPKGGGLWDDASIPGWQKVAGEIKKHGAKAVIQIGHLGRSTNSQINGGYQPVAPSAVPCHLMQEVPHELTIEEIEEFKQDYLAAVKRAVEAGFDAIEIHFTHGYLLASFLSGRTNKRTDAYGGTLEGRLRLPLELIAMVRKEIGRDYPLLARLASHEANGGRTVEESKIIAKALVDQGLDALDISAGSFTELDWEIPPYFFGPACNIENIEQIKHSVDVPVIASGRIVEPRMAEQIVAEGRADLVGINRALIADPFWAKKAGAGDLQSICRCIGCTRCIDELFSSEDMTLKCTVNPFVGKENELFIKPAEQKKNVLVIGGGPAGLEAAKVAAERGHKVTLFEKEEHFGGQVREAAVPPLKYEIASVVNWLIHECEKYGVELIKGKEATVDEVKKFSPDAVVLATGANSIVPNIKGIDRDNVTTAVDVLAGKVNVGSKVAVIGAGMVGCETAEFLAEYGKKVTVIEMLEEVASDVGVVIKPHLMERLRHLGIDIKPGYELKEIREDCVTCRYGDEEITLGDFETIVLAMGMTSNNPLEEDIKQLGVEIRTIGDASEVAKVMEALQAGLNTGMEL